MGWLRGFPRPYQGQLMHPRAELSLCTNPALGVHLISSESAQPSLEVADIKPFTEEEPKCL